MWGKKDMDMHSKGIYFITKELDTWGKAQSYKDVTHATHTPTEYSHLDIHTEYFQGTTHDSQPAVQHLGYRVSNYLS